MKFIHQGWGIISEGEKIFFHDSDECGKLDQYYCFDGNLNEITANEYFQRKYGPACKEIMSFYGNNIPDTSFDVNGNVYVSFYQNSHIQKFNPNGEIMKEYEDSFDTIYDIEVQDGSIWVAYPTANIVKRFNLNNFEEEISIGDRIDESIFCLPESIVIYKDFLYVSDMGNNRIRMVNLNTFQISDYKQFNEPVWEYIRTEKEEYVRLQSGIYLFRTKSFV